MATRFNLIANLNRFIFIHRAKPYTYEVTDQQIIYFGMKEKKSVLFYMRINAMEMIIIVKIMLSIHTGVI